MGAKANLSTEPTTVLWGGDDIVIRHYGAGIIGGRTLDMTDFPEDVVRAGHVVIRDVDTDTYKPLPVSNGAYASLPSSHEYVGVVVRSKVKEEPMVGIMYNGEVNDKACPFPMTTELLAALKTALPNLVFLHD